MDQTGIYQWRAVDCENLVPLDSFRGMPPGLKLLDNIYVSGEAFLQLFNEIKDPKKSVLLAAGDSQLIIIYSPKKRTAFFFAAPWRMTCGCWAAFKPRYLGESSTQFDDVNEIRSELSPGHVITIKNGEAEFDVQAFPSNKQKISSSAWTGRDDGRVIRVRHSAKRYFQIGSAYAFGTRIPVILFNKKFSNYVVAFEWGISFVTAIGLSFVASPLLSVGSSIAVFLTLKCLHKVGFFSLAEISFPAPDFSNLAPKPWAKTSGVLDQNVWKQSRALSSIYPDALCVLYFTDENEMLEIHRWLLTLTNGQLDDHSKNVRLSVIVEENLEKYFVCIMTVRESWKLAQHSSNTLGDRTWAEAVYETGADFSDKFDISPENRVCVQRFLNAALGKRQCALAIGCDANNRVLSDVFIVRDFRLIMLDDLDSKSHEFFLLRRNRLL